MSTLEIVISRDDLPGDLDPMVLSGSNDENVLGITSFVEPGRQARIRYAPPSDVIEGDIALAATYQQSVIGFNVVTDQAATEAESREQLLALKDALGQFRYEVTITVDTGQPEVWTCDTASITPLGPRTFFDLEGHNPVWAVAIPCRPTPS